MSKIITLEEFLPIREEYRRQGKRLAWTNGCFDILHAGHIKSLEMAKDCGDVLLVGLNADASVKSLKDPDRPFVNEDNRARLLASLECVDHVIIFADKRCDRILSAVTPDAYVKGGDYTIETMDQDERKAVEKGGGTIKFIPLAKGLSTSNLVKKIRRSDPEKIISGAFAFIINDENKLLMVANQYEEGIKWGLPGGGHSRNESLQQTVIREAREETSLDIAITGYAGLIERIEPARNLHLLCHQFSARVTGGELHVRHDEEQVVDARFVSADEIQNIPEEVLGRKYILQYLAAPSDYPTYIFMGPGEE